MEKNKWTSWAGKQLKMPEEVNGFNKLNDEDQELFSAFLYNFYNAWEYPEKHIPYNVKRIDNHEDGCYLRVDFYDREWYHVISSNVWY